MSELIRFFTSRPVNILSQKNIQNFGINSHPENYQSQRYKKWLELCHANKHAELKIDMTDFLLSKDSIKTSNDLGKDLGKVVTDMKYLGSEINKEKVEAILKQTKLDSVFSKEKATFSTLRTATADTILCLAHLKNLSHKSNIDYLTTLKTLTLIEKCFEMKNELTDKFISTHYNKHILLPSCFSKLDPCNPIDTSTPFAFLHSETNQRHETKVSGCKSENCTCIVNDNCVPQSKCCAKPRIDVIDLLIVKDYTKCYQAGDLSFIKNVLEGETLSTKHSRLERTEELVETEEDIKQFEERYLQTEEKASLQKETENIVKQDSAFNAGVTAKADWGTYMIQADAKYSTINSKSDAHKEVVNSSKDIIDRATKQVEEKVRKLVSTKRIFETKETNKHEFNNTSGDNISGQYLYVNKVSRGQVYNYGRKAVIDLILPEPAELFKRFLTNEYKGTKPNAPTKIVVDPKTILPENYKNLISQYGLKDVPNPPDFFTDVVVTLEGEPGDPRGKNKKSGSHTYDFGCSIPPNYEGISMSVNNIRLNYNEDGGVSISATLGPRGDNMWHQDGGSHNLDTSVGLPSLEGSYTIVVHTWDVTNFTWQLIVRCQLKQEFKEQWQNEVYSKIEEINKKADEQYQKELAEYNKAKEEFEVKEEQAKKEKLNKNPFINRETEKNHLKRMAISYISCQFYDQFDAMKNKVEPCGYPEMNIKEAEEEGKFIQFFEQAFNWNLLTYIFYPFFWGKKCSWKDKLKDESNDLIFQKFLEAGSCRVLIPIRDGYFDYVSYFLSHGEIWGGTGTPPLPNDPHYVSVAQELKEQKQNFYADREGTLDVTNGSDIVILNGSDYYWDYNTNTESTLNIEIDIDREIIIDCKVYRIVSIVEDTTVSGHLTWKIKVERNYQGDTASNLKWSTGALFVGAPWEFVTPTTLTFLRDKSKCLPCYPLKECKE